MALILLQNYYQIDNVMYDTKRVRGQVVDAKELPFQVSGVLLLANGDIAVSGGPSKFEILIYRHNFKLQKGRRDTVMLVDSVDTRGCNVLHMLEINAKYLLVIGHLADFRIFERDLSSPDQTFFPEQYSMAAAQN